MNPSHQEAHKENTTINKPEHSRFHFLDSSSSPKEGRPNDLRRLQDDALRKREEFRFHIQSIEDRIATWISKLSEEALRREKSHSDILQGAVYIPIEQCMERVQSKLENQTGFSLQNQDTFDSLRNAERKIMDIDMENLQLEHVTVSHVKNTHIRPLEDQINEDMPNTLRKESSYAHKCELTISRQLEETAGQTARELHAEKSTRDTELQILKNDVNDQIYEERRVKEFMVDIHEIQKKLDEEILERKKQDQMLLELILNSKKKLQETVLETLGRGEDVE